MNDQVLGSGRFDDRLHRRRCDRDRREHHRKLNCRHKNADRVGRCVAGRDLALS